MKITKKTITETTTEIEGKIYKGEVTGRNVAGDGVIIKIKEGFTELPLGSKVLVIKTEGYKYENNNNKRSQKA